MSDHRTHVIFGTGQVGSALAARLAATGAQVRAVSRRRPASLPAGVEWRSADATDPEAVIQAGDGAAVIYQCLNAPYAEWPERFPPMQRNVLAAAERHDALLVSLENLYAYGDVHGEPMTEDLPLSATTVKGRARAAMTSELLAAQQSGRVRQTIGRASDFFGAGVTASALGDRVFRNAVNGKPADFLGDPDLPHTYTYIPDIAAGLATLGTDPRAIGEVWHIPGPATSTTRQVVDLIAGEVGHPVRIRDTPKAILRTLGIFNPTIRALAEMEYQFEAPFVLDTAKYERTFGQAGTPMAEAIAQTVLAYTKEKRS